MSRPAVGPPRGLLARPGGEGEHVRVAPAPVLAPWIAHFWSVRWDRTTPLEVETLPHPTTHLVVEHGRMEVRGVSTRRFVRTLVGRGHAFGIKLRPATLTALWVHGTLREERAPITRLFGREAAGWARALDAAPNLEAALAIAEPFLAARLRELPAENASLRDLVERMERDRGLTSVEDVAHLAGVTPRTLERRFRAHVGLGPKWVLKRYRLHEAAARLLAPRPPTLARLARELGYFDQAHFTRDFRAMVGRPPSALVRR